MSNSMRQERSQQGSHGVKLEFLCLTKDTFGVRSDLAVVLGLME